MRKLRNRYILFGPAIFIAAIGTLLHPEYISLKNKITKEFELTVQGASLDFNEAVNRHVQYLNQSLDESFRNLESSLINEAMELDGYLSRMSQGEKDVMDKVSNIFQRNYKTLVYPGLVDFENSYNSELAKLEDGLLIRVNRSFSLDVFKNKYAELNQSSLEVTNILRSPKGLIIKVVDDSLEWVPIVGDVWGFLKIAYDPRKENLENKIFELSVALRSSLDQKILKYSTLNPSHVENICRGSFNANYAVINYTYLTYIRR